MTERGGVVLLMLLVMLMASSLSTMKWSDRDAEAADAQRLSDQLMQARRSLIEYAVTYPQNYALNSSGPGRFPCPDSNGNGDPGPLCPRVSVGLLPRGFATSSGIEQRLLPGDSIVSEPLVWVVAGPFRNRPAPSGSPTHAMVLNSSTLSALRLDGRDDIIGLVIAPGPPLAGQIRGEAFDVVDYLEGENADGDSDFSRSAGNDQVLPILWKDVLPLVERQVLAAARSAMRNYAFDHGQFPGIGPVGSLTPAGDVPCDQETVSGWLAVERYRAGLAVPTSVACIDAQGVGVDQPALDLPGWLVRNFWHTRLWVHKPSNGDSNMPSLDGRNVSVVLASAGPVLLQAPSGAVQATDAQSVADLLDHEVNTNGDAHYRRLPGGNDQWLVLDGLEP